MEYQVFLQSWLGDSTRRAVGKADLESKPCRTLRNSVNREVYGALQLSTNVLCIRSRIYFALCGQNQSEYITETDWHGRQSPGVP